MADDDTKQGGDEGNWRDTLSDDLKGAAPLQDFKDIESLAKSFVELKSYQGNSLRIPGEDASDDARKEFVGKLIEKVPNVMLKPNWDDEEQAAEFYRAMGRPDDENGYQIPEIETDGIELNTDSLDLFRKAALAAGLNRKQFEKIAKNMMETEVSSLREKKNAGSEDYKKLQNEWGFAMDRNLAAAVAVAKATGAPEAVVKSVENGNAGSEFTKWLYNVSTKFGKEGVNFDANDTAPSAMSPAEAKIKISEIMNNKAHPYWNPRDPANKSALDRMVELQRYAIGA